MGKASTKPAATAAQQGETNAPADQTQTTSQTTAQTASAEAEEILAAARAEADKILADARAQAEQTRNTAPADPVPEQTGPKMVKIRLFKDNEKYKDDVFVAVNGKSFQIKRGEDVEVPDFVAEVLERSMKQDQATADMIDRESSRYAAEAAARNL